MVEAKMLIQGFETGWTREIKAVKELGDKIGYGNMMDIASSLWAIMLEDKYGHSLGAFEPVCMFQVADKEKKKLEQSRKARNNQIRKLI